MSCRQILLAYSHINKYCLQIRFRCTSMSLVFVYKYKRNQLSTTEYIPVFNQRHLYTLPLEFNLSPVTVMKHSTIKPGLCGIYFTASSEEV